MILRRLSYLLVTGCCLAMLTACYDYDTGEEVIETVQYDSPDSYINISFTVESENTSVTRTPEGGENGDGREAGFMRENMVTGVTMVFYQNSDGINATSASTPALADTKVKLVKYYPVTLVSRDDQGTTYTTKADEAVYTTGEQRIEAADGFDYTGKYRVLVIANADLTSGANKISAGDFLGSVREKVIASTLYTGTGLRSDANTFVMTSENDLELNFAGPGVKTEIKTGSLTKLVYTFTGIRIERMAARIDFSTQYSYKVSSVDKYGAEYKTTDKNGKAYPYPGYVYPVYKSTDTYGNPTSEDRFVVTAIVPFNLSLTNTGCYEFLFKRTDAATSFYLADETGTNWVIDPGRSSKNSTAHPAYFDYNLSDIEATMSATDPRGAMASLGNYLTTASFQSSPAKYDLKVSGTNTADNLIIAYPKENTLLPTSPLYYYATGIAIEGYYIQNNDVTKIPTRFVYVGYLRHHDTSDNYGVEDAVSLDKTKTCDATKIMNFGVVRNNIYRVAIHKINEKSTMELSIKVKKWDPFIHDYIYM